jgi:ribonuclease P protein component
MLVPALGQCFPAEARLRRRSEFLTIQRRGERVFGRRLIILWTKGATPRTRIGITVSKKVGNAVRRNQIKRWIREVFRRHPGPSDPPLDLIVTAKRGVEDFSYDAIRDELTNVLQRIFARAQDPEPPSRRGRQPRSVPNGRDRSR